MILPLAFLVSHIFAESAASPAALTHNVCDCRSYAGARLNLKLSRNAGRLFDDAARQLGTSRSVLLSPLIAAYRFKDYDDSRLRDVLATLRTVATEPRAKTLTKSWRGDEPHFGNGDERLILYLDPTCPDCAAFLGRIRHLIETCPAFPGVVIRPAFHDDISRSAAVALELIRQQTPGIYFTAFFDFTNTLSNDPYRLQQLLSDYLPADALNTADAEAVTTHLQEEQMKVDALHGYAPMALLRDRLLLRLAPHPGEPFDPLRDDTNLLTVVALVKAIDQSRH